MNASRPQLFDAHFHITDPAHPVKENQGFLPDPYLSADYTQRVAALNVAGGAVVSGSFQGFDQGYLVDALEALGPGFVGVTQIPADTSDEEIQRLDGKGITAVRFNLKRGGSAGVDDISSLASRVYEVAGWHTELYVDARDLGGLESVITALPRVSIDHLGMHADGLPTLLRLVEQGVKVKATGFGRVELDPAWAMAEILKVNPEALMVGTDLPSTRAQRPFHDSDLDLIADTVAGTVGAEWVNKVFWDTAARFYGLSGS